MKNKRFNIADILLAALLVVMIVAAVMRISDVKNKKYETEKPYMVSFTAGPVDASDVELLVVGSEYKTEDKEIFGILAEGYFTEKDKDGESVMISGSFICGAISTEDCLRIGKAFYRAGDTVELKSGKSELKITLTGFEIRD